jgi:hypothetical protein
MKLLTMSSKARQACLFAALVCFASSTCAADSPSNALDWMLPKLCADSTNKPVSADPYYGCPANTHLRPIAADDALPYRKIDNARQQYKDMYPRTAPDGTTYVIATFDWLDPKNAGGSRFKVWADGYDAYMVKDGWASGSETRIGTGEYGSTFFGKGCKNYNGLIFFPEDFLANLHSPGSAKPPISGEDWEENDHPYPGVCPSHQITDQIFTWLFVPRFPFGDVNGAPVKALDTIVTTMGLRTINNPAILAQWKTYGHLEVFYFTKLYGLLRWESWVPNEQLTSDGRESAANIRQRAANAGKICSVGPNMTSVPLDLSANQKATGVQMTYEGSPFTMIDCRDWSNIVLQNPPVQAPAWPVSGLNLLRNFHFNGTSLHPLPNWDTSHLSHAALLVSTTKDDTTHDTPTPLRGIAYLRLGCSAGCNAELIHQDITISSATPSGHYTLGVIARTEAGSGSLKISLAQMDEHGADLSKATFIAKNLVSTQSGCDQAGQHCHTFAFDPKANTGSVVLASNFVSETIPVTINPMARKLRFEIDPMSNNDFDVVSAWLMVSP